MESFFLSTSDHKKISVNYYKADFSQAFAVCLHMMPATKESWDNLALALLKENISVIAIDLRGHGNSSGGPDGFVKFTDEEHKSSKFDIDEAINFLISVGAEKNKIVLIGASIGANLAISYLVNNSEFKKVVALSAGLNYHGIDALALVGKLKQDQKIFLAGTKDDKNVLENDLQLKKIFEFLPENIDKQIEIYDVGGHGTDILKYQPELIEKIKKFILN